MGELILFFKGVYFKLMPIVFSVLHFLSTFYETLILSVLVSIFLSIVMGVVARPRIKIKACLFLVVFLVIPFTSLGVYLNPESNTFEESYNMYVDHYDNIKSSINHICELQADIEYTKDRLDTYYADAMRYKKNAEVGQFEEDEAVYVSILEGRNSVIIRYWNTKDRVDTELSELNKLVTQLGFEAFSLDSLKYFSN